MLNQLFLALKIQSVSTLAFIINMLCAVSDHVAPLKKVIFRNSLQK